MSKNAMEQILGKFQQSQGGIETELLEKMYPSFREIMKFQQSQGGIETQTLYGFAGEIKKFQQSQGGIETKGFAGFFHYLSKVPTVPRWD